MLRLIGSLDDERWRKEEGRACLKYCVMQNSILCELNIFFFFRKERLEKIFAYYICWKNLKKLINHFIIFI